jgi:MYXO-CTERM domain-containing protein
MRPYRRNFILTAAGILAILLLCPSVQATTIKLTGNYTWNYEGIAVGPYLASLNGAPDLSVFCLDLHIGTGVQTTYAGGLTTPSTEAEDEAAFLAAYSLYLGSPSSLPTIVTNVEGPVSLAIWQLMGTMGDTKPDPAAAPYIQFAQYAYSHDLIPTTFLATVSIWTPDQLGSQQRFMTAVRDDSMIETALPEPGTAAFLGTGVLLLALGGAVAIRRRRRA